MREILEGVYTWSRFAEPQGYNFNGYVLHHDGGNIAVDPVEPEPADLDWLAAEGLKVILITNRNHARAANRLREATGARTAIHAADADHARKQGCAIDEAIGVGETWGPLLVVPADGKSPGEVALHWAERRLLIVGDAVIGKPPGGLSLLPEEKLDDPAGLRESVRGLLSLDFDALLTGDGEPILTGAKTALRDLVARLPD